MALVTKVELRSPPRSMSLLFLVFMNIVMLISRVEGKVHYYDFVLKQKSFTRHCVTRDLLVVNDQFPGPTVYVDKGDTMFVNVYNEGGYGVTIHWHGVKQPRNPWSDGPEYITQCPIAPGTNFTYEVIFSEEEGTLWWHAHSDWTRNTVHGAIVINPAEGTSAPYPTPYADEVVIIGSWYDYDVDLAVEADLEAGLDLPTATCHLINGQPGGWFNNCSTDAASTYSWSVEYNKTYLLRIINAAMSVEEFFGIAAHTLTVVGVDGAYLKPFETPYIVLEPGQTMNVLVTMDQSPASDYYMMAREFLNGGNVYVASVPVALVQYEDEYQRGNMASAKEIVYPDNVPMFQNISAAFNFFGNLRSLADEEHPVNVPINITTRMFITVAVNYYVYNFDTDISSQLMSMNNISWVNTDIDVLQAYYSNISGIYTEDFPDEPPYFFNFTAPDVSVNVTSPLRGTKVKMLDYNEEVEVVFQATNVLNASQDHPMHLHGHSFYVVGFGLGNFDPEKDPLTYNLVDPPYVNTFFSPRMGWMTLRFRANNPGVWLWHCHIDKHLSWGMNTVFIVRGGGTPETTMRSPPSNMPVCKSYKSKIGLDSKSDGFFKES